MARPSSKYLLSIGLVLIATACGGGDDAASPDAGPPPADAAVAPVFRNPLPLLEDSEIALEALQLMGAEVTGADRNCNACHGLTRTKFRDWLSLTEDSLADCLTNLAVTTQDAARPMADCMRENPALVDSPFSPSRIGFYAVAAHLDWFDYLFDLAYGDDGNDQHAAFAGRVLMPRGAHAPFTQDEFDVIAEWVARGLPLLDDLVPDNSGPGDCTTSIGSEVAAHVTAMETTGWGAVNASNNLLMYGCAGAATTRDCMADQPRANSTVYGAGWETALAGSVQRVLHTMNYNSAYWTRSSADGRFVAHGGDQPGSGNGQSTIIDLVDDHRIGTPALYDPGFFPDNSGWALQLQDAHFCDQRVLTAVPAPTYIDYTSPMCMTTSSVGLYQHIGAAPGGGDYWTVDGVFESDSGGHQATLGDPDAPFITSNIDLVPMVHNGTTYEAHTKVTVTMNASTDPEEGDTVISPSSYLLVSRVRGISQNQNGFVLRKMNATPSGDTYTVTTPQIARYCFNGGKPGFSFDERWMAIHHYIGDEDAVDLGFDSASDPDFQDYRSQGAANVYLVDLLTGEKIRITNMAPGQYALFPHFRSDGWIYYNVRVAGTTTEYIVASDAALLVAGD